ncbi:hypothetical protein [Streptomyces sp. NPDC012888]|uniref:hypothetical protein n=1 Tax=Streptomyces sp. NPDC012888 TaxID=3364855 RepID=UPI0036A42C5B
MATELTYDPREPERAVPVVSWPWFLVRMSLVLAVGILILWGGCVMAVDTAWYDCEGLSARECGEANR